MPTAMPAAMPAPNARVSRCFSIVGSPHYVAPEVLPYYHDQGEAPPYSFPLDVWGFGAVMWDVIERDAADAKVIPCEHRHAGLGVAAAVLCCRLGPPPATL